LQNGSCRIPGWCEARHATRPAMSALQGDHIWPSLLPAAKEPSLRAGLGAAVQGHMDQCSGVSPWIATSQTLLTMTEEGAMTKG